MGKRDKVNKDRVNWDSVWGNWFGNLVERARRSSLHHFCTSNERLCAQICDKSDTEHQ